MKKQLTLNIEESIIKKAKSYAKNTDRSLSELVEGYLDKITNGNYVEESETVYGKDAAVEKEFVITEWLRGITGTLNADIDYVRNRDKIRKERYAKYLK